MTATIVTAAATAELLAGADDRHGEHENRSQGWDRSGRTHAARHGRLDPGADNYGRHAAVLTETRPS